MQSESFKQSSMGPDSDGQTPDRPAPDAGEPVRPASSLYVLWFAASLVLALAGAWGVVAGWVFGLPGGGEIRRDVFGDQRLSLRDLFVAIPHPDLAELPFVPKSVGAGYEVREKFRSIIVWKEDFLTETTPAPAQESFNTKQESFNNQAQTKLVPNKQSLTGPTAALAARVPVYATNLGSARTILAPQPSGLNPSYCLTVDHGDSLNFSALGGRGSCIALFLDMPANTPTVLPMEKLVNDLFIRSGSNIPGGSFRFVGRVFPNQASPDLYLADFIERSKDPVQQVGAVTWGTGITGSPAAERPIAWIGGLTGNIYKISPDSASSLDVTRLNVPFAAAIDFIAFVSTDRGWVWTESTGERGVSPAAAQTFDGGKSWQQLPYRWLPAPWVFIAFVLAAFAFERGTTARIRLRPVATEKYIADHGVSDDPIGMEDADALGLAPIAASMARFLRNTETKPTVAIGVTGPWGCGKTSLMNLVRQELAARDVRTVWFNAWHNQKEENLLAALLVAIRTQAVPPLWTFSGFVNRFHVAWKRVGADPNATIALGFFALAAMAIVVTHLDAAAHMLNQFADRIASLLPGASPAPQTAAAAPPQGAASAITSIGLSTGGITAIAYAGKKLWDLFKPLKSIPADLLSTLNGQSSTKDLDQQLSFRYRFASEFAIFCDTLRRPPYPGLVIFIDDLDRCAPKQTVDILEAINFVTSAGRCFVVLGLDENKVRAAIADSYKDMTLRLDSGDSPKHPALAPAELQQQKLADLSEFASRYLEKLIHLVVPVPRSRKDSVELLLGLKPSTSIRAETPKWRKVLNTASEMLGTVLVVGFLMSLTWLALDLATRLLPTAAISSAVSSNTPPPAGASKQPASPSGTSPAGPTTAEVPRPTAAPPTFAELSAAGLTTRGVLGTIPSAAVVVAFALLLMIMSFQFLPRLQTEPVVSDGPQFQKALEIWLDGISQTRETPRSVKRFVNRLRFMAMRLRDLSIEAKKAGGQEPLAETDLVAMAVIEDLDRDCLGETDNELWKRQISSEPRNEEAAIILSSLERFRDEFRRDPYANPQGLLTYRLLAGLVAEGRGDSSEADPPQAATQVSDTARK